jgi:DNA-directed RNA polymerase specialized sigma24 family protein
MIDRSEEGNGVKDNGGTNQQNTTPSIGEEETLLELLQALAPRLDRLFHTFSIPAPLAEEMLEETVMNLFYRQQELVHPDRWLLRTLRRRCVRYWRDQKREHWLAVELHLHDWLEEEGITPVERRQRRRLLSSLIERLPIRCRGVIRRRFQPPLQGPEPHLPHTVPFLARELEDRCMAAMLQLLAKIQEEGAAESQPSFAK